MFFTDVADGVITIAATKLNIATAVVTKLFFYSSQFKRLQRCHE